MPSPNVKDLRQKAEEHLDNLGKNDLIPMPYTEQAKLLKLSCEQILEYDLRQQLYEEQHPAFEKRFQRPQPETVETIWNKVLEPIAGKYLSPDDEHNILPAWIGQNAFKDDTDKQESTKSTLKEALVIALDTFISYGRRKSYITYNDLFDAMCFRYSDWYKDSDAGQIRDMSEERAKSCRRDLLLKGIDFPKIWDLLIHYWLSQDNPLFSIDQQRPNNNPSEDAAFSRDMKKVRLKDPDQFLEILNKDESYIRRHSDVGLTALITKYPATNRKPIHMAEYCADIPYNRIEIGKDSEYILSIQEETRILLDVDKFKQDYVRLKKEEKEIKIKLRDSYGIDPKETQKKRVSKKGPRRYIYPRAMLVNDVARNRRWSNNTKKEVTSVLLPKYDHIAADVNKWSHLYEQVQNETRYLEISNEFYRTKNRRYQPQYVWPTYVTDKKREGCKESYRNRWFKARGPQGNPCELVGVDISSSQTQIIAALMGIDNFEQAHMGTTGTSFKEYLAETAWKLNKEDPIFEEGPTEQDRYLCKDDDRLIALVKDTWLRRVYGSHISRIVRDQRASENFNPGWKKDSKKDFKHAERFIDHVKDQFPEVFDYLNACEEAASDEKLDYSGITFTDPYDGAKVRWNPVARAIKDLKSNGDALELSLPGKIYKGNFKANYPKDNEYPVNRRKLKQMVAPCLVHMLDGYYSSLVMEGLKTRGINDFVSIHDCWLVPEKVDIKGEEVDGKEILIEAIESANNRWYEGLGTVFEELEDHLQASENPKHLEIIRTAHDKWKARKGTGHPPRFRWSDEGFDEGYEEGYEDGYDEASDED